MVNKNLIIKKCTRYDISVGVKFADEIQKKNHKIPIYIIYFVVPSVLDRVSFIYNVSQFGTGFGAIFGTVFL